MNTRSMHAPRRIDTRWAQTDLIDRRRATRTRDNAHRRRPERVAQGYTVVVLVAAIVTAVAYVVRELILWWPA